MCLCTKKVGNDDNLECAYTGLLYCFKMLENLHLYNSALTKLVKKRILPPWLIYSHKYRLAREKKTTIQRMLLLQFNEKIQNTHIVYCCIVLMCGQFCIQFYDWDGCACVCAAFIFHFVVFIHLILIFNFYYKLCH